METMNEAKKTWMPIMTSAAPSTASRCVPAIRGLVLGDGPKRPKVLAATAGAPAHDAVDAPAFVGGEEVRTAFARGACLLLPSRREDYGPVVIETAAVG